MPGYDRELNHLRAAKAWGLTPREWRLESGDDRAWMLMFVLFEGTVEAYRAEGREKRREARGARPEAKDPGGDQGMFSRMKERLKARL